MVALDECFDIKSLRRRLEVGMSVASHTRRECLA